MSEIKLTFIQRTVDAPDKEYLSREEAAAWIGIGSRLFQALVDEGEITPPISFGKKTVRWHWSSIYAYIQQRRGSAK